MGYKILIYQTLQGKKPFDQWFDRLKETKLKALILDRLDRMKLGNLGDFKNLGDGIFEIRLHCGAGYRLYYAKSGEKIILILCAGDKSKQQKDIEKAKKYWLDFKSKEIKNVKSK